MSRYIIHLFGITVFALALIWFAGPGDASQLAAEDLKPVLWADTVHYNLEGATPAQETVPTTQTRDAFLKAVHKLTQTAFDVRQNYMEEVDMDKIINAGIRGMLYDLDRFSVLMEQSEYENLMENTHGKYQGLGMRIDARDDRIVIESPIEGTPAYRRGLRAGDVIWEIDGKPTEGMTSADAAKLMRGDAGTTVKLQIRRTGIAELLDFEIERAVIELKSVNYWGIVPGTTIGYVRLSRFAEETSQELREAISSMNQQNITSLIFDLRSNGGGLLDQANETAELFLQEGKEIVYTKGRDSTSERHYRSTRPPLFPSDKPLVILVDEGTASASEIVAGAIQDWDRGVIMGSTTYGKGLVQQIFNISNDGSVALKLTTAKYYVPSGRCIQRPERQGKHPIEGEATDSTAADSLTVETPREVFYTNGGRVVYGGGGIVPDVEIEGETWKPIEINLERKSMFFDFAVEYVADHPDVKPGLEVTDDMVNDFRQFVKDKAFSYKSTLQLSLDELQQTVTSENKEAEFSKSLAELSRLVEAEKDADFDRSLDYIKRAIRREIVRSIAGERGFYEEVVLKSDKAVKQAVELLNQPQDYSKLITEGKAKAQL
jgi:carboxyl-terminal processing protease